MNPAQYRHRVQHQSKPYLAGDLYLDDRFNKIQLCLRRIQTASKLGVLPLFVWKRLILVAPNLFCHTSLLKNLNIFVEILLCVP